MYVHTAAHAHLFSSVPCTRRLLWSVEEQTILLRGGLRGEGSKLNGLLTGSSSLTATETHWNT